MIKKPNAQPNNIMKNRAFTLIELMITIVIAAIIITPLTVLMMQVVTNSILPEHYQIATSLLEGEIEKVANLRFDSVIDEGPTSYAGDFAGYSYQVDAEYVNANALNTSVSPTATAYKKVSITISRTAFPDVSAVTLVTDN